MPVSGERPCPLCGALRHRPIARHSDHHLVRCGACGMVFTGIGPTDEELQEYYAEYPVRTEIPEVTIRRYNEMLDRFERFRGSGRMLEVGCGSGAFLVQAARRGWEVHGTEFGDLAVAACRANGIQVIAGPLEPANYPPQSFDMVLSFEVLEHVTDPKDELARMDALMRPGGALFVTTPNHRSLTHMLTGKSWSVVNYPEHLNYFTPRTLRRWARARQLRPVKVETTGVSLVRLQGDLADDNTRKEELQGSQERFRERLENNALLRFAKRTLNAVLDLFGIGESMKGLFVKPSR